MALTRAQAAQLLRTPRPFAAAGRRVTTANGTSLLSFATNDYLGLADHPELRDEIARGARERAGAGSSRVVAGTLDVHERAEAALAEFVGHSAARLFPSAYAANLGLLGSLFGPEDILFSDELNHASLIDGCRLSRARVFVFEHKNLDHLSDLLREHRGKARVAAVLTESAFSMDGDIADLPTLRQVATQHDAALIVDEAHALGVVGSEGRGLCAETNTVADVMIGGLGKSFGLAGGFIGGSATLAHAIDNFARTFIYSTAILPAIAEAIPTAIRLVRAAHAERERLSEHSSTIREAARRTRHTVLGSAPAAIIPIVLKTSEDVLLVARRLEERGLLVPAMRPPTVPYGTARLRITPSAGHSLEDIRSLAVALTETLASPRDDDDRDERDHA